MKGISQRIASGQQEKSNGQINVHVLRGQHNDD